MSALAEDLLEDFDEDEEEAADEEEEAQDDGQGDDQDGDLEVDEFALSRAALLKKAKERHAIGSLRQSSSYLAKLAEVEKAFERPVPEALLSGGNGETGALEDDPEYQLVVSCNRIAQDIDEEMEETHLLVKEIYSKKFPELEGLVSNKLDYVKTVLCIGNEMDISKVQSALGDFLPSAIVMIISVSGSTTSGQALSSEDWAHCLSACNEMMRLKNDKQTILSFVESRMQRIAPNLVHIVGARVASQLVGLAGGIVALSKIPACNMEVLGHDKRNLAGLSSLASKSHFGILVGCDLVQACVGNALRRKCIKVVAAKVTLASRIDSYKNHNDGSEGIKLRKDIESKLEKWAEPDQARTKRALPVPEEKRKSKRGGKRVRKMKERFAMTDLRAQQNKISFSVDGAGSEYGDSAMGFDTNLAGLKDTGKLRAPQVKKKEVQLSKKAKKALSASSGQISGLSSSIVQTNTGGFELRPVNAAARVKDANDKWFSANSGFMSAMPK